MYTFLIMNVFFLVFIGIGCKKNKKNNASKLKPRDMSKEKVKVPPKSPDETKTSPAPGSDEKIKKPEPEDEPPMAPREADDNETINDAPSVWGPVK